MPTLAVVDAKVRSWSIRCILWWLAGNGGAATRSFFFFLKTYARRHTLLVFIRAGN